MNHALDCLDRIIDKIRTIEILKLAKHPLKNLKGFLIPLHRLGRSIALRTARPVFCAETIGKIDSSIRMSSGFWVADIRAFLRDE